ncbi:DUF6049 family protein [uncultured Bifidobacterium sp.]|uniref:DUF6049 family protein n=1 Tax=uncultured Bifidobacterium sp. TaxID=165187 RepID=UPI00260B6E1E|nr:DUF6049 family protein [uncultured Bifidobacterium sp.]
MTESPLRPGRRTPQSTRTRQRWTRRVGSWITTLGTFLLALALTLGMALPTAVAAQDDEHQHQAQISLKSSTPVVTDRSGYTLRVTVTNTESQELRDSTLSVGTNAFYSFSSRTDMQSWSEGRTRIPTPDDLDSRHLDSIKPGQSADVTVAAAADNTALKKMVTWGPKPVRLTLTGKDNQVLAETWTFLTRTWDGLPNAGTPAMSMTMVLPLTTTGWTVEEKSMTALMTQTDEAVAESAKNGGNSASPPATKTPDEQDQTATAANEGKVITLSRQATKTQDAQRQLLTRHSALQVLADPTYLTAFNEHPRVNGLIQPADFDISTYAGQDPNRYIQAGIAPESWSTKAGTDLYARTFPDQGKVETDRAYAWQGRQEWSMDSVTEARKAGYTHVIAPRGFEAGAGASAHTGKFTVNTQAGQVTILSAQRELSNLAQGNPTSTKATGEQTQAGQVARFMAQSAFYQMEQPYDQRDLMVCFDTDQDSQQVEQIMAGLEHAPWISLGSLDSLDKAADYSLGPSRLQENRESDSKQNSGTVGTLDSLTNSRQDITRFSNAILAAPSSSQPTASATTGKSDSQALARQDADTTARQSKDPTNWLQRITKAHDCLALHALGGTKSAPALADQARAVSDRLLDGIRITPSESLTVVSETASMPVTVSNNHPYPVYARVSAKTDSMEIVTSRTADTIIPARSEAQVTFKVRVATAGQANVDITLIDRNGKPFGQTRRARITSNLRLSDMSGLIIVVIAVLLGMVGLWRQFHRKKDPDE